MATEVKIPQISEGVETATVTEILVSEGDNIEKDQSIIAVESDKAAVEIPSSHAGKVKSIKVSENDEVNVGDVILTLDESGDGDGDEDNDSDDEENEDDESESEEKNDDEKKSSDKKKSKKDKSEDDDDEKGDDENEDDTSAEDEEEEDDDDNESKKEKSSDKKKSKKNKSESEDEDDDKEDENDEPDEEDDTSTSSATEDDKKSKKKKSSKETKNGSSSVPASPGVRRFARELGVDISKVESSDESGRISKNDIKAYTKDGKTSTMAQSELPDFSQWGKTERKALSGIRKTTAKKVSSAWQNIPHVFQFDEADITEIEDYMDKNQDKAEKAGTKLTITAVLTKLVADGLERFPKFNASLDLENNEMVLKDYINIGIAVDTEKGLMLPVIKEVDKKGIIDLAVEISELAEKARNHKLTGEEMKGGNFSISNLGGIGGTNFTPIIYHPQVAILGVSRAQTKPIYKNGQFEPRKILPLSLSYDHRLIDGAEAARFITWLKHALEDPFEALLS